MYKINEAISFRSLFRITLLLFCFIFPHKTYSQDVENFEKKCTVVLTYDDGLDVHLDNVIPALDKHGFKGTFYIPGNSPSLAKRLEEWRSLARNGHELGNHTLFHPCFGKSMKREWVNENYDLDIYSIERFADEILLANTLLKSLDGKTKRTFAYTCGDKEIKGEHIWDKIGNEFSAARGVNRELLKLDNINIKEIGSFMVMNHPADEMIEWVKEAMKHNSLIVFLFHGVGGGHDINVSLQDHNKLLQFLKENEKVIWVAPLIEVADYISSN